MTIELVMLAWGCILAIVHIFVAVRFKTRQYGTKWNFGARDEELPPPAPIVGRLARAQANFFETFPIAAAAPDRRPPGSTIAGRRSAPALARRADRLSAALRFRRAGGSDRLLPGQHRRHPHGASAGSGRVARLNRASRTPSKTKIASAVQIAAKQTTWASRERLAEDEHGEQELQRRRDILEEAERRIRQPPRGPVKRSNGIAVIAPAQDEEDVGQLAGQEAALAALRQPQDTGQRERGQQAVSTIRPSSESTGATFRRKP